MSGTEDEQRAREQARLKGFRWHMIGYFAVMAALVPANLLLAPDRPWFVLPMVGWGAVLAAHTAWVMGLFGR